MKPLDTHAAAHEAQMRVYRGLSPDARVRMAFEMSEEVRRVALEGIDARHPEYDEAQRRRALLQLLLGDGATRAIWPGAAAVAP
jgi:hypothetical protein